MTDGTRLHKPPFFNCTITTSKVQNANPLQPFHSVPDKTGEVAAGAIALDGYVDNSSRQPLRYTVAQPGTQGGAFDFPLRVVCGEVCCRGYRRL